MYLLARGLIRPKNDSGALMLHMFEASKCEIIVGTLSTCALGKAWPSLWPNLCSDVVVFVRREIYALRAASYHIKIMTTTTTSTTTTTLTTSTNPCLDEINNNNNIHENNNHYHCRLHVYVIRFFPLLHSFRA